MTDEKKTTKKKRKTKAQRLVELITSHAELWHSGDSLAYASYLVGDHWENWRLGSRQFKQWAYGLYYAAHKDVMSDATYANVQCLLEQQALQGRHHQTYRRVARVGDTILVDLSNPKWQCVEVTADGWRILDKPPVKFLRSANTGELPTPERGGTMDELRPLVTSSQENWLRIKGYILDAFKGRKPYFVLVIHGTHNSGKTYACVLVRKTIDPCLKAGLARLPSNEKELGVSASSEHVLAYDNVSKLQQWLSDTLCMVATGGGFKARTLYTDGEQTVFDASCPIILNGVPQCAESNDLLSRALLVEQPQRSEEDQRTEAELDARYEEIKGRVFGGILDMIANGLRNYPTTHLTKLPRMADSVKWITACFGDDTFLEAFKGNEEEATACGLDCSPIARALLDMFKGNRLKWEGTAKELLATLKDPNLVPYEQQAHTDFPANANALGKQLRRDVPLLLKAGLRVENDRKNDNRMVRIDRVSASGAA